MQVYLIAAPENEAEGAELAKFLKTRGVMVREEYGQFAYGPARPNELTLALWSRKSMMSVQRIMLTNRAIDAWEQDSLVMARLEHGLSPHGLGDLEMVDLTFAAARLHHSERVLQALREMETRQRDARLAQQEVTASAPPMAGAGGGEGKAVMAPAPAPMPSAPPKMSRGSGGLVWLVLLILLGSGGAFVWWLTTLEPKMLPGQSPGTEAIGMRNLLMIGGGFVLLLVALLLFSFGRGGKTKATPELAARRAPTPATPVAAPAPTGDVPEVRDVFVSYAHANSDTVLPLASDLEAGGVGVWIDRDDLKGGQGWAGMIVRAIKSSGRFCLMCSAEAFASDHVRREVYLADKYGKPMLPVRLDDAPMPEDIEYFLIDRQWVDLTVLEPDRRVDALKAILAG